MKGTASSGRGIGLGSMTELEAAGHRPAPRRPSVLGQEHHSVARRALPVAALSSWAQA